MRPEGASGVGYGAIGGAASAALSPLMLGAIDPNHGPLTTGQIAFTTTASTLFGGALAGALGQNVDAAALAAANEALNNGTKHWVNAVVCILCMFGIQPGSDNPFEAAKTPFSDDPSLGVTDPEDIPRKIVPTRPFGAEPSK